MISQPENSDNSKPTHAQRVLTLLKARKSKGVTFQDFATGFRLAARIHELRNDGHDIVTLWEHDEDCKWARYVLT